MGFQDMKNNIMEEFNKHNTDIKSYGNMNFSRMELENKKHRTSIEDKQVFVLKKSLQVLKCKHIYNVNSYLQIAYPGYKTMFKNNKTIYDYRVDYINNNIGVVAVSHPTIILDLYNKVLQAPEMAKRWKEFLIAVAYNGESTDLEKFKDLNNIKYLEPNDNLIRELNDIFNSMNKSYLSKTNLKFNFTLEELKHLISWIALQEDINYPISKYSKLQGRKMPFYRYIEAIFIASNRTKTREQTLKSVIKRAIEHNQPILWEKSIDYSEIKAIEK